MAGKILVVDDDEEWLRAAVQLFTTAGYTARGAASFPEARLALDAFQPDLLVTDVRLKEYNGLYLLARLRPGHPRIASLVVSGYVDPVLAADARRLGAHDFLVKPIDPARLLAEAAEALGGCGRRRWPRTAPSGELAAQVAGQRARLLDVSYSGVRLELPFVASPGVPLEILIPSFGRTMTATVVWLRPDAASGAQHCGAVLQLTNDEGLRAWRRMVDDLGAIG